MKSKIIVAAVLGLALNPLYAATAAVTQTTTQTTTTPIPAVAAVPANLKDPQAQMSYSIGLEIGSNIKQGFMSQSVVVDPATFAQGVQDAIAGNKPALTGTQIQAALAQFQTDMTAKMQTQARQLISANHTALVSAAGSPVAGSIKGNTTLIEFFDYQCVHCREMAPILEKIMKEDPNLRVVYKEFPIFGESSNFAAEAALAAAKQGKYPAFHSALMTADKKLDKAEILALAKKAGLNVKQLQKDMASPEIAAEIKANMALARAMNISGTPAFIITPTVTPAGKADAASVMIPGSTNLQNLQQTISQVQNGLGDKSTQVTFPSNEKDPQEASGTWQGI